MRHDPDDDLEGHEADDQHERDRQVAPIRVGADAMRMTIAGVVTMAVLVIGLAVLTAHRCHVSVILVEIAEPFNISASQRPGLTAFGSAPSSTPPRSTRTGHFRITATPICDSKGWRQPNLA